jgi:hypothetical protein
VVGRDKFSLSQSYFVEKKYSIVPQNTKFDEVGMLEKYKLGAIYQAELS